MWAAFYVSPLPCAQYTAAAIADIIGQRPLIDSGLREFDLGAWEGRTFLELRDKEHLWERWRQDPHFMPPQGESPSSFHTRVVAALQRLVAQHPTETVLIVTHGGMGMCWPPGWAVAPKIGGIRTRQLRDHFVAT